MSTTIDTVPDSNVSLKWREQYVSAGLNKRNTSQPKGVVRGFNPTPGALDLRLTFTADALTGDSVARIRNSDASSTGGQFMLTYTQTGDVTLDLSALSLSTSYWIGLVHDYTIGSSTSVTWEAYTEAEFDAGDAAEGTILCKVTLPGSVGPILESDIDILDTDHTWKHESEYGPSRSRTVVSYPLNQIQDQSPYPYTTGAIIPSVDTAVTKNLQSSLQLTESFSSYSQVTFPFEHFRAKGGDRVRWAFWAKTLNTPDFSGGALENSVRLVGVDAGSETTRASEDLSFAGTIVDFDWTLYTGEFQIPSADTYERYFMELLLRFRDGDVFLEEFQVWIDAYSSDAVGWQDTSDRVIGKRGSFLSAVFGDSTSSPLEINQTRLYRRNGGSFQLGAMGDTLNLTHYGNCDHIGDLDVDGEVTVDGGHNLVVESGGGGVGVGLAAGDTPDDQLHIRGSALSYLRIESTDTTLTSPTAYGGIRWESNDSDTDADGIRSRILVRANGSAGATIMEFANSGDNDSSPTDVMHADHERVFLKRVRDLDGFGTMLHEVSDTESGDVTPVLNLRHDYSGGPSFFSQFGTGIRFSGSAQFSSIDDFADIEAQHISSDERRLAFTVYGATSSYELLKVVGSDDVETRAVQITDNPANAVLDSWFSILQVTHENAFARGDGGVDIYNDVGSDVAGNRVSAVNFLGKTLAGQVHRLAGIRAEYESGLTGGYEGKLTLFANPGVVVDASGSEATLSSEGFFKAKNLPVAWARVDSSGNLNSAQYGLNGDGSSPPNAKTSTGVYDFVLDAALATTGSSGSAIFVQVISSTAFDYTHQAYWNSDSEFTVEFWDTSAASAVDVAFCVMVMGVA